MHHFRQRETLNLYDIMFCICEAAPNALIAIRNIKMLTLVVLHANVMETNPAQ